MALGDHKTKTLKVFFPLICGARHLNVFLASTDAIYCMFAVLQHHQVVT